MTQGVTDENKSNTGQGASAADINTTSETIENPENIGSGVKNPTIKEQINKVSYRTPTNLDDIDIASGDVGLNMLDTAVTTSEGQQILVSIFKDTGTVTRPKTQIEATPNTFPGMPPTIKKTGVLPPKGTGTTVDFNTMTSDTLTSDSLFTSEEDKGRTRLFNNRGYNDLME